MKALKNMYDCQEFLLSPLQFEIPNSRIRYYCLVNINILNLINIYTLIFKVLI